jgi:hypothetical protein
MSKRRRSVVVESSSESESDDDSVSENEENNAEDEMLDRQEIITGAESDNEEFIDELMSKNNHTNINNYEYMIY